MAVLAQRIAPKMAVTSFILQLPSQWDEQEERVAKTKDYEASPWYLKLVQQASSMTKDQQDPGAPCQEEKVKLALMCR
jgi:hypothetical protein